MERVSRSIKKSRLSSKPEKKPARKRSPAKHKATKNVSFQQPKVMGNGAVKVKGRMNGGVSSPSIRGLRQMSIKICEKVKACGKTTCNEVADELINLIMNEQGVEGAGSKLCDDKNIRRRLYDALNVLDAVDVVEKDNKDIVWKGMPNNHHQQARRLVSEQGVRKKQIKEKEEAMREKLMLQVTYRNLVRYNQRRQQSAFVRQADKVPVPFVLANIPPDAEVHCDASRDMSQVMMDVDAPFTLQDESAILSQMGFNRATLEDLREMLPEDMLNYYLKHDILKGILARKRAASAMEQDDLREAKRLRKAVRTSRQ